MKSIASRVLKIAAVAGVFVFSLMTGNPSAVIGDGNVFSRAEAVIGRPLTPMSYAGVARRTTRRAVVAGAAVGAAAAAAPVVVAPACVQVVDAYGRLYWRCP